MGYFASKYGNQSMAPNQSIAPIQSMLPKKPPIVAPKKQSILQSILTAIKNAPKKNIKKTGEVVKKNIEQAGKAVMGVSKVGEGILKFGKGALIEAPARAAGAIALDLTKQRTLQPKSPLEKLFFGKEPIESISKQIKEAPARAEKTFGIPQKYGKIIGPSAVIGLTALDLTPMGKITKTAKVVKPSIVKNIIEQGAKQTERIAPQAAKAMRSIDVSKQAFSSLDDVVKTIKTAIGKQGDDVVGAATRYADNYAQMLKDPALAKKASEQLFDIPSTIKAKPITQSLAEEAKKYKSAEEFVKDWVFTQDFYKPEFSLPGGNLKKVLQNKRTFNLGDILSDKAPKQFQDIRSIPIDFVGDGVKIGNSKTFGSETLGMTTIENGRPVIYLSDRLAGSTKFNDVLGHEIEHALTASKNPAFFSSIKSEISATANVFKRKDVVRSQLTDIWKQANQSIPPSGGIKPPSVPPKVPPSGTIPSTPENAIQKLIKAVDEAIPLRAAQKKLYSQEMAKRTARVASVGGRVGGEKGFFAQLGQLKGELPKKEFEAIRNQFSQQEADLLFDAIEKTKTLLPLEKVATKGGLRKLFEGAVPTPSEINHLKEVFPKELVDAILTRRPIFQKMAELGIELTNVPRTMMATTDLSFGFRQGVFMLGRPKQFFPSFKEQFKFFGSEKAYQGLIEGIKSRPTYLKMKQAGLALTDIGGQIAKREEAFMGNLAERIPLYGRLVRASDRAYTGFANKLRADLFDDLLGKAEIAGKNTDDAFLKSLGDFINAGTGRGKFGLKETGILPKSLEKAAPIMNALFFSPRLMASRLNLLNPYFYIQLDPFVRKEALKTLFADAAIFTTIYGLWKLNGGEAGVDPRSADFGKIKVGNTRYDILGGFQQYIKLAAQLVSGEIVSSTTGRTITLGEGYKPLTRKDIIMRFFENKTSPIASFVIGLLTGVTATGQEMDIPTEMINRFTPMVTQDLYDISQEKGAEGLLYGLPAIFGTGVQTYGKQELAFGKSKLGEETAQIRPVPELSERIRELVLGKRPLGASKSFSVETYLDQLDNLPREEAADIFDEIKKTNPELAKKLNSVVKERELGITVKDKDLKGKSVSSGDRALMIKKEFDKLKTNEEKAQLWDEYKKKGIITKEVSRQLNVILNQ